MRRLQQQAAYLVSAAICKHGLCLKALDRQEETLPSVQNHQKYRQPGWLQEGCFNLFQKTSLRSVPACRLLTPIKWCLPHPPTTLCVFGVQRENTSVRHLSLPVLNNYSYSNGGISQLETPRHARTPCTCSVGIKASKKQTKKQTLKTTLTSICSEWK